MQLFADLTCCRLCPDLGKDHVAASGPLHARLAVIGQSPGAEEVEQGIPFCGASGRLLRTLLDELLVLREEVYVTNVVKCRPPENRPSSRAEVRACKTTWLQRELELVQPDVLLLLGRDAHQAILPRKFGFIHRSVTRTKRRSYVTLRHPAFFLRAGDPGGFLAGAAEIRQELEYWSEKRGERSDLADLREPS